MSVLEFFICTLVELINMLWSVICEIAVHHDLYSIFLLLLLKLQVSVKESLWRSLEEDMIPSLSTIKSNWLDLQPKLLPKKYKESNVCVAGGMKVMVFKSNALQDDVISLFYLMNLPATDMHLFWRNNLEVCSAKTVFM